MTRDLRVVAVATVSAPLLSGQYPLKCLDSNSRRVTVCAKQKGRTRMTSGRRLMALAVAAGFLVLLPSCHRGGPKGTGPQYIMLTYNNGTCQQNGGTGVVDVAPN